MPPRVRADPLPLSDHSVPEDSTGSLGARGDRRPTRGCSHPVRRRL